MRRTSCGRRARRGGPLGSFPDSFKHRKEEVAVTVSGSEIIDRRVTVQPSPYEESLSVLNKRVDWIPMGWQALYTDMRVALAAAASPIREQVTVCGGCYEDGLLYVDSGANDAVVQGVLRKARARAKNTCAWCGCHGARLRQAGECIQTLCGKCGGLYLLKEELTSFLSGRDHMHAGLKWREWFGTRLWIAIQGAWPASLARIDDQTPGLNVDGLEPWMHRLRDRVVEICSDE